MHSINPDIAIAPTLGKALTGTFLIASPGLSETPFAQSVIYICAHSAEDGAMGLVINRRLPNQSLAELLTQLGLETPPLSRQIPLCAGGPLDSARGFVLHSSDWDGDGSLSVDADVTLTASLDVLREIAEGRGPRQALLAVGHAAWEPGQLENEIIRRNLWYMAPKSETVLFGSDLGSKWRRALATIDLDPARLTHQVGHA